MVIPLVLALTANVVFQTPAGRAPAGPLSAADPFARILPSGRLVRPAGTSVTIGTNAQGFTLTPSGRYAVVSSGTDAGAGLASSLDPATSAGFTVSVVDTVTLAVVGRYSNPAESYFAGMAAVPDPLDASNTLVFASGGTLGAVYAFDVDASGQIKRDAQHVIRVSAPTLVREPNAERALPTTLVPNPAGTRIFVVDTFGNDVAQIDTATRALTGTPVPVGYFPFGAALVPAGLLVANQGLLSHERTVAPAAAAPPFATVPPDLARASSLMLVPQADGVLEDAVSTYAPLDRTPDGVHEIGGAQPAAVVAMRRRPYAFVAMSGVDRIATLSLGTGVPLVAGGTELRLYDRGPYGTQPVALALAPSERRLYVALAGIDAIAVLDTADPVHLHRVGLIPTGWYPSALALSPDGRFLYVTNAKGYGSDGASSAVWSTFERIDLSSVDLRRSTPLALAALRTIVPAKPSAVVPQHFAAAPSARVSHVVCVLTPDASYDSALGDQSDAAALATPNLHALARTFALAGNFYADADSPDTAPQLAAGGIATSLTQRLARLRDGAPEDPEDYPRAGYIFNALAERGRTYRDYGQLLYPSGFVPVAATSDPPGPLGLGGRYTSAVPAPLALAGHVDLDYPGRGLGVGNARRAAEFVRDYDSYVKTGTVPAFAAVTLPAESSSAAADADRALGTIVAYLSHAPQWNSTAIFVMPSAAADTDDHVAAGRSYALVVSPYAKRHYVGMRHLSTVSVLKTEEELLGLPALSLGDALTSDLSDFFDSTPNVAAFEAAGEP